MTHLVVDTLTSEKYQRVAEKIFQEFISDEFEAVWDYYNCRINSKKRGRVLEKRTLELVAEQKTLS